MVELLDYIEEGLGMGCLVMELLPGGDLYTQVAQRFTTRHEAEPGRRPTGADATSRTVIRRAMSKVSCGWRCRASK